MGMYDTIKCEYPMPKRYEFLQSEEFQTKDFENLLDRYTITKDGILIHHKVIWEMVPEEERPYYGTKEWEKNMFFHILGSMKTVPVGDEVVDFHGILNFYTTKNLGINNVFYNLYAKFTDGKLVNLDIETNR